MESKLFELSKTTDNIEPLLAKALNTLTNLGELYENADNAGPSAIIGSMFPEKLTFDRFNYRTARLNEAVELIYAMGAAFTKNKTGQNEENFTLSCLVTPRVQFSNHFIEDLMRLANLMAA